MNVPVYIVLLHEIMSFHFGVSVRMSNIFMNEQTAMVHPALTRCTTVVGMK